MASFCVIFASCIFSMPRAAHFRPAFEIRTDHIMFGSMVDMQSPTAEIRRGKKKKEEEEELECGPMPYVMAALPNIGGALCSTPQSLADAHCWSTVQ